MNIENGKSQAGKELGTCALCGQSPPALEAPFDGHSIRANVGSICAVIDRETRVALGCIAGDKGTCSAWKEPFLKCYNRPHKPSISEAMAELSDILPENVQMPTYIEARRLANHMHQSDRDVYGFYSRNAIKRAIERRAARAAMIGVTGPMETDSDLRAANATDVRQSGYCRMRYRLQSPCPYRNAQASDREILCFEEGCERKLYDELLQELSGNGFAGRDVRPALSAIEGLILCKYKCLHGEYEPIGTRAPDAVSL